MCMDGPKCHTEVARPQDLEDQAPVTSKQKQCGSVKCIRESESSFFTNCVTISVTVEKLSTSSRPLHFLVPRITRTLVKITDSQIPPVKSLISRFATRLTLVATRESGDLLTGSATHSLQRNCVGKLLNNTDPGDLLLLFRFQF